jgi:cell division initiation protein
MPLTPVEIRHLELHRSWLRGYRKGTVDRLLGEIADSFEEVWRERADLADRLDELETEAAKHRELEALLRSTLVSAERAAHDMKEQARRESDLIVQEAQAEGRRLMREMAAEKLRLEEDIRRIRAMLRSALELVDERPRREEPKAEEAEPPQTPQVDEVADSGIRQVAS